MRRAALIGALALLMLAAPAAARPRETSLAVRAHGALTVDFRGDEAAGCEEIGNCAFSGTITWTPPRDGLLFVDEYGRNHQQVFATLLLGLAEESKPVAQVHREADGGARREVCADVADFPGNYLPLRVRKRQVEFGLSEANLVRTRCAGPLQSDLAPLVPRRVFSASELRRGERTVDLSGEHPFSSRGFVGTVKSTLRFDLRDPEEGETFGGGGGERVRELTARYDVSLTGDESVFYYGVVSPLCEAVDSCNVQGRVLLTPEADRGQLTLVAVASARRPRRDLRTALGLSGHGRPGGIATYGFGNWRSDTGLSEAVVQRSDSSPDCRDSVPLRRGGLIAYRTGSQMPSAGIIGTSERSASAPWPISRRPGPRRNLTSPTENGGKL